MHNFKKCWFKPLYFKKHCFEKLCFKKHSFRIICLILASMFVIDAYAITNAVNNTDNNTDNLIANEYYIPYNGQQIHLKEKKLSSSESRSGSRSKSRKVIVLINPLSIPALSAFDVPGYSLMNDLAQNGYDVWGIDFIGEGKSTYPKTMNISPAPIGTYPLSANQAVKQLHQAIDYISKQTGKHNVALLGWSWGSVVGAMYAIQNPHQINHLVLYGSMYSSQLQESIQPIFIKPFAANNGAFSESLPAYQNIAWQVINSHWHMMINGNTSIAEESAIDAVGKVYIEADPAPVMPNSLRRPMGPIKDLYSIWNGKPIYDISKLTVPTLVIYGDQDFFADHDLYNKLTNVKIKQKIELKQATHWLIYEKTRQQFINDVVKFLNNI
ncbi:MAG: hypothetical protein QG673_1742 [Pseudomonadota bacterium]|nr:hypothetical protein [Pseudomonadota bacterium]